MHLYSPLAPVSRAERATEASVAEVLLCRRVLRVSMGCSMRVELPEAMAPAMAATRKLLPLPRRAGSPGGGPAQLRHPCLTMLGVMSARSTNIDDLHADGKQKKISGGFAGDKAGDTCSSAISNRPSFSIAREKSVLVQITLLHVATFGVAAGLVLIHMQHRLQGAS